MGIFEKVKILCEKNKITFNRLEKECGLSRQIIEKWDNSIPRSDAVVKIAKYFGVSTDYLLGLTDNPKPYE